jgi:hypothetical protein
MEPAEILRKVEPSSGQARLLSLQQGILARLLHQNRTACLQEHEAILGPKAYTIADLLLDLRAGIFGELMAEAVKVDPYRRNLQRAYITLLGARLDPPPAAAAGAAAAPTLTNDDSRGAIRAELKAVKSLLQTKVAGASDKATRNHAEDLIDQITVLLDPRGVAR